MSKSKVEITNDIQRLIQSKKQVQDMDLTQTFPILNREIDLKIEIINYLKNSGIIKIINDNNNLAQKYIEEIIHSNSKYNKMDNLTAEQKYVYEHILSTGNKGTYINEVKLKLNMATNVIKKCLLSLTNSNIIKSQKSLQSKGRNIQVDAQIEPSSEITGGIWQDSHQNFDGKQIDVLLESITKYFNTKKVASLNEVEKQLVSSGVLKSTLSESQIKQLLLALELDNVLEKFKPLISNEGISELWRFAHWKIPPLTLREIPCGLCPVIDKCQPEGKINPNDCPAMNEWLNDW